VVEQQQPVVGVVMGSDSDLPVMGEAADVLRDLEVPHEVRIVSAHRTPDVLAAYAEAAAGRGLRVIVAGAGGAAHLPGMLAAHTALPVVGVPVPIGHLQGVDALLSIVQMPRGVPVATVAIGGARNAAHLAARILATADPALAERIEAFRREQHAAVVEVDERVRARYATGGGSIGFL
jgi:5-(carboxyamino)imidazole ribonucleotide mutase